MKLYLFFKNVTFEDNKGNVFELTKNITYIGRSSACEIKIPTSYTSISRKHFFIKIAKGKIFICDNGSANGTFLNGKKLTPNKLYELIPCYTVSVGNIYITLNHYNGKNNNSSKSELHRVSEHLNGCIDKIKTCMLENVNEPKDGIKFISKISEGGMSEIIKAKFLDTKEIIAIKIPNQVCKNNRITLKNFEDEISMSLHFRHENVIQTYMRIKYKSYSAMVMEYFPSTTLRTFLLTTSLSISQLNDISWQLMNGLEYIHKKKILHNDVKPSNILIDKNQQIKINDFGAAYKTTIEIPKQVIGTVSYMAPERINHGNQKLYQTDIYSFGIVLYEMYTKKHPFISKSASITTNEIKKSILAGNLTPPREINNELHKGISDFILRCVDNDPNKRFKNVNDMKVDFKKII
ncbi:MAG: protein kinase [Caldisericia bacterium]|nr:protein kinase [Caldisericia bacterium]